MGSGLEGKLGDADYVAIPDDGLCHRHYWLQRALAVSGEKTKRTSPGELPW